MSTDLAALLKELDPLAESMDDLAARLHAAGVRVTGDAALREALEFIADWAHDCIDTGLNQSSFYGFDAIEAKARAALAPTDPAP